MKYGTWETIVYGKTFEEIQRVAESQAKAFGLEVGPKASQLMYDIRPHTMTREMDGRQSVIDYEARIEGLILD